MCKPDCEFCQDRLTKIERAVKVREAKQPAERAQEIAKQRDSRPTFERRGAGR